MSRKRKKPMSPLLSAGTRSTEPVLRSVRARVGTRMKPPKLVGRKLNKRRKPLKLVHPKPAPATLKIWSAEKMFHKRAKKMKAEGGEKEAPFVDAVAGLGGGISAEEDAATEGERTPAISANSQDYMCTTLCDLLIDIPTKWDELRSQKVLDGLLTCVQDSSDQDTEDTHFVDLRGRYIYEAKGILILNLCRWYTSIGWLKVRVGCDTHGVGQGKLKDAIIDMLNLDQDVKWRKMNNDTIISIQLNGQKNYHIIKRSLEGRFLPVMFDDDCDINENDFSFCAPDQDDEEDADEDGYLATIGQEDVVPHLCTIACDLLYGLRKPPGHWDERLRQKVLAGFMKCYQSNSDACIEGSNTVDLRGLYVVEATELLVQRLEDLSLLSPTGCLKVIVGCREHGVGEGKLKQAILDMLKLHQTPDDAFFVNINLNAETDYRGLGKVFLAELITSDSDSDDSLSWFPPLSNLPKADSHTIDGVAARPPGERESLDFSDDSMVHQGGIRSTVEVVASALEDEGLLCIINCRLLIDFPELLDRWWDEQTNGVGLVGLEVCDSGGERDYNIEDGHMSKITANSIDRVVKLLFLHLHMWSRPLGCVNLIVGCKLSGIWKMNLKEAITNMLILGNYEWQIWEEANGYCIILVNFER